MSAPAKQTFTEFLDSLSSADQDGAYQVNALTAIAEGLKEAELSSEEFTDFKTNFKQALNALYDGLEDGLSQHAQVQPAARKKDKQAANEAGSPSSRYDDDLLAKILDGASNPDAFADALINQSNDPSQDLQKRHRYLMAFKMAMGSSVSAAKQEYRQKMENRIIPPSPAPRASPST